MWACDYGYQLVFCATLSCVMLCCCRCCNYLRWRKGRCVSCCAYLRYWKRLRNTHRFLVPLLVFIIDVVLCLRFELVWSVCVLFLNFTENEVLLPRESLTISIVPITHQSMRFCVQNEWDIYLALRKVPVLFILACAKVNDWKRHESVIIYYLKLISA